MSATTVHAFPAFNSLLSPRAWMLVVIVLLHAGFFWSLSNGLSRPILAFTEPRIVARFLPDDVKPLPPPPRTLDVKPRIETAIPVEPIPVLGPVTEGATSIHLDTTPNLPPVTIVEPRPAPVIVQPQIDPARTLSQPAYPPQDIRMGNTGTVLLAVLVLPDGTVGDVRVERSSGFPRLDASASSEARQWRFRPGLLDGVPRPMWKQLPIVFRLED
jgi:periplasmic protein TonB